MNFKTVLNATLLCFLLISSLGCSQLKGGKTLKLAHGLNEDHPVHKGLEFMARRVAEKSGGQLRIEIYPNQQLGTERQCLELLQIGSLAMTKVSGAVMENFAPKMQVLSLPYIFRNMEHAHKVFDGIIGRDLLKESERYWLRGLTFFDAGQRSFYTKDRPVNRPSDLKGLKIRVQESASAMELVRLLGGAPTPISWGELYTALQQGVVDGAENNPPSFYTSHHYEVCKYYSLDEHTAVPDILVIGTVAWNNLSSQEQQWLQEAADEAALEERKLWQAAEVQALAAVKKAGVKVIRPAKEPFIQKTKSMFEEYENDEEIYSLIQNIQAVQ